MKILDIKTWMAHIYSNMPMGSAHILAADCNNSDQTLVKPTLWDYIMEVKR